MEKQLNMGKVDIKLTDRFDRVKIALRDKYKRSISNVQGFEFMLELAEKHFGLFDSENEMKLGRHAENMESVVIDIDDDRSLLEDI